MHWTCQLGPHIEPDQWNVRLEQCPSGAYVATYIELLNATTSRVLGKVSGDKPLDLKALRRAGRQCNGIEIIELVGCVRIDNNAQRFFSRRQFGHNPMVHLDITTLLCDIRLW